MEDTGFIEIGRVIRTHGLRGEVSVAPATDLPFVLAEGLTVWFVPPPLRVRSAQVVSVRPGPKGPLIGFSGVEDIDTASTLRGTRLLARAEDVPDEPLDEEFDPVGLALDDVVHGPLGEIVELIVTGANDVWVVHGPYGEILVPDIEDVVLDFDEEARTVKVRLLPGLLPEESEDA